MGSQSYGISPAMLTQYAADIKNAVDHGCEVAIVIGGGNIFRGLSGAATGMDRVQGDYMGMLATLINSMALQAELEKQGWFDIYMPRALLYCHALTRFSFLAPSVILT